MTKKPFTSCIIPTYNGSHLLENHLPAVLQTLRDGDQLIICDDASTDSTVSELVATHSLKKVAPKTLLIAPEHYLDVAYSEQVDTFQGTISLGKKRISLLLLANHSNIRFAAAVNLAACFAKHPTIFLLNNDVSPESACRDVLVDRFSKQESIFAIGCLEYEDDLSGEKSGKNKLWFERGLYQHAKADDFSTGETAWASGGSALFDRDKWYLLEGFDLAFYPAYWEDIDLSFRARKRGWRVLFEPDAVVLHQHETTNASAIGQAKIKQISWRNSLIFSWKHSDLVQKLQFILWQPYWLFKRFTVQ